MGRVADERHSAHMAPGVGDGQDVEGAVDERGPVAEEFEDGAGPAVEHRQ